VPDARLNLNSATAEDLRLKLDIPTDVADAIVRHRAEIGAFRRIEQVKDVDGVGDVLFKRIAHAAYVPLVDSLIDLEITVVTQPPYAGDSGQDLYLRVLFHTALAGEDVSREVSDRFRIDPSQESRVELSGVSAAEGIEGQVETGQGEPLVPIKQRRLETDDDGVARVRVEVPLADLGAALDVNPPEVVPMLVRGGRFTVMGDPNRRFDGYRLSVDVVDSPDKAAAVRQLLGQQGGGDPATGLRRLSINDSQGVDLGALELTDAQFGYDGSFEVKRSLPDAQGTTVAGWAWVLNGPDVFVGFRREPTPTVPQKGIIILLPAPRDAVGGDGQPRTTVNGADGAAPAPAIRGDAPLDVDEEQLLDRPELFSDDPGTYCRPFSNPSRILGERRFHTVFRVEQPEIASTGNARPKYELLLPEQKSTMVAIRSADVGETPSRGTGVGSGAETVAGEALLPRATRHGGSMARFSPENSIRHSAAGLLGGLARKQSATRKPVSGRNPIDWDGDTTRHQAQSVAGGHILEWRLQWRSNGYSLGNVAHTLTLAPRQTKRIVKLDWRRLERSARFESTTATDSVDQVTERDRDYNDAVQSSLSEWSKGGSSSSTTGVAGGIGFAAGPVVIGGGAAHGRARSDSWQRGGRSVAASEEQTLRDAVRQYADSVRQLESTVITEATQEETVEGVSEVIRNVNYCHSLTVIYHEILRHIRVDTVLGGVRECLFVPFAITPFTPERLLRWRDVLERRLRKPALRWAFRYLEEVVDGWSAVPAGARADQRLEYLSGSLFIRLGVERPQEGPAAADVEEGLEEEFLASNRYRRMVDAWLPFAQMLGRSVKETILDLQRVTELDRDRYFQREVAPAMARRWVDSLSIETLEGADFTMAGTYGFNKLVRVDYTVPSSALNGLTRREVETLVVKATRNLPAGSVANVTHGHIRFETPFYERKVASDRGVRDLIHPETGAPDSGGAQVQFSLSAYEERNMRTEILQAVDKILDHVNDNLHYYHKVLWWSMDRDELYTLLDGFAVSETESRSIASVVERNPIAILGNTLVFKVAAGAFLGIDGHKDPTALLDYYRGEQAPSTPMRISLPTDGLYAQAIMDECVACEEHEGTLDWVLSDTPPEVADFPADLFASRRTEPQATTPTPFGAPIISLQNAPAAPAPAGLQGALGAVTTNDAFRDMAGLQGTQQLAGQGMQAAAGLATSFGQAALQVRLAQLQADKDAGKKLAAAADAADKAVKKGQMTEKSAKKFVDDFATKLATGGAAKAGESVADQAAKIAKELGSRGSATVAQTTPEGASVASFDSSGMLAQANTLGGAVDPNDPVNRPLIDLALKRKADEWATDSAARTTIRRTMALISAREEYDNWASNPADPDANRFDEDVAQPGSGDAAQARLLGSLESYIAAARPEKNARWHEAQALDYANDAKAWSASFISFLMSEAGIGRTDGFHLWNGHSRYTIEALVNRLNRDYGRPFWLFRPDEVPVAIGDIVVKARGGATIDFNEVFFELSQGTPRLVFEKGVWRWGGGEFTSHADMVMEIVDDGGGNRFAYTIGGNTEHLTGDVNTVGKKKYLLDATGHIDEEVYDALHSDVTAGTHAAGDTHDNNSAWAVIKMLDSTWFDEWKQLFERSVDGSDTTGLSEDTFLEVFGSETAQGGRELPAATLTFLQANNRGANIFPESNAADFSDVDRAVPFKPTFTYVPSNLA
jgi:competence ComEA-like helix-hairpin-helix protein